MDDIPDDVLEEYEEELMDEGENAAAPVDDQKGVFSSVSEQMLQKWSRPAVGAAVLRETIAFQWTSIDLYTGSPLAKHPTPGKRVPGSSSKPVPVVRLYGVTAAGHSVCCHCHGFTPYCYSSLPAGFEEGAQQCNVVAISNQLDSAVRARVRGAEALCPRCVLGVEVVRGKQSIMGYCAAASSSSSSAEGVFLKIYVALPTMIPSVKNALKDGISVPGLGQVSLGSFESNVPFTLRFLIDNEMTGCNWVEAPAGSYKARARGSGGDGFAPTSRCTLEIDVVYDSLVSHAPDTGEWSGLAPLRVLATDIECQGRRGHFPEAEKDPVIQISCVIHEQGCSEPTIQAIFTLGGCLAINGAEVVTSETEAELLLKWAAFVRQTDPDVITGYNTQNFDMPYLLDRAATLRKRHPQLSQFFDLGRVVGSAARKRESTFASAQMGKRVNIDTTIDGRVMFDLLPYMYRNHKLSSYSLNSVCAEFLGQQKEDVHYSIISVLQNGTDEDRRRLAVYCLKDSVLVIRLMTKLAVLINYIEMSRVTGVPLDFLLSRGQQIKVFSMLLRRCRASDLLVPCMSKHGNNDDAKFEGATVIEPMKAFYQEPIATLDFASLYPSIMQAYNLCYSTILSKEDAAKLPPDAVRAGPECADGTHYFVTAQTKSHARPAFQETTSRGTLWFGFCSKSV